MRGFLILALISSLLLGAVPNKNVIYPSSDQVKQAITLLQSAIGSQRKPEDFEAKLREAAVLLNVVTLTKAYVETAESKAVYAITHLEDAYDVLDDWKEASVLLDEFIKLERRLSNFEGGKGIRLNPKIFERIDQNKKTLSDTIREMRAEESRQ